MRGLERQRHFLDFTISCLARRKGKNMALVTVYALVVFLVASAMFFGDALRREANEILKEGPEMVVQRVVAGRHDLIPLSYMDKIKAMRGVQAVRPRLWGYYYRPASRSNYTIMAVENFRHGDDSCEVGQGVLRTWGAIPGNELFFKTFDGKATALQIAGKFNAVTDLATADLILMSETAFRRISGVPEGYATDIVLAVRNSKECPTIAEKIIIAMPDTRPILREEVLRTYSSVFHWRTGYIIVLLSGAFLAFLIFAWDKATGLSSEERAEIGILKAVGWDTSDVLLTKFWEGTVISLAAFLLGIIGAYLHVHVASAPLFEHAFKGWAVLYPEFRLSPSVNPFLLAVLFLLTVVPYTLITIIPAWRVSVTDPDMVMRQG
jgi:ABC-type lipoprotein release transport system permease subunit